MGVSWVLSTNESAQSFEIALERMGAKHNGTFKVDCTVYKPTLPVSGQIGQFFLLHHSNFPDSACCFGDPFASNPTQDAPMARATTDLGFELIMQKFTASLVPDQLQRFEVNGAEYHLKDFRVRVGTALVGTSTKGTVVEFEFAPCAVVMQCIQMLSEFVMTFFPNESSSRHTALKLPGPLYRQRSSPDNYRVSDTLEQYLWVFAEMRKKIPRFFLSVTYSARKLHIKARIMSDSKAAYCLDLESIEAEFQRALEESAASDSIDVIEPEQPAKEMHAHEAMAQLFVNHVVDENPNKTLRLQQKLLRTDEREAKKRQDQDELGRKKALLEGLWELYEYNVPKEQIRKLLNIHKYDQDKVMDQIFEEFFADDLQKKSQPKNQVVKTVYSPRMPMIFDRTRSPTSKMSRLEETEAEALYFANKYAEDLKQRAKHHQESAFKHGPKDARFGALTAIARDENKRAEYFEDKQFEYKASNLSANDSIDLHNMKVAPALRYVKICIDTVKKRRPTQKTLEIITGRGANNPNGKPVMKLAVQQFLANMKMSYQPQNENPGTVFVKLL